MSRSNGTLFCMVNLKSFLLIVALLCPPLAPAADPPDLLQFVSRPDFHAPSVSPDGKYLAVVVGRKDRDVLRLMHIGTMNVTAEVSVREAPDVLDYAWTGNDRIVVSFGIRSGASTEDSGIGGEIFAINVDKSDGVYLFGRQPDYALPSGKKVRRGDRSRGLAEIIDGLPDDPRHIVVAVYRVHGFWNRRISAQLYKVDAYGGDRVSRIRVPDGTFGFLLDRDGRARVASGVNDHLDPVVYYREPGDSEFRLLDALRGTGMRFGPAVFDDVDNAIYFPWSDDASATGISSYTPSNDEIETIWEGREFDVYEVILDQDGSNVVAITVYADKHRYVYIDQEHRLSRLLASLQSSFPDDDVVIGGASRDQGLAVIAVGNAGRPEDYYLADVESMHIEHLFSSRAAIDDESLGTAEHFEIESRDGATLRGYVTYPPGDARTDLPMVVLRYGDLLSARSYDWFDPHVQAFASRGYAVLQVNHRGSVGYGAAYEKAAFRNLGTIVQDDIADAVRWSVKSGIADPARICIVGMHFGAYSALMGAAREPGLYACAIGHNGIYDLPMAFGADRLPNVDVIRDYVATVVGADDTELARQSPITHVSDIRADLLISYERFRRRSPPAHSKALMKALDRAGIGYERYTVQQNHYRIVDDEAREAHYRRMLEFLAKHIGAGS